MRFFQAVILFALGSLDLTAAQKPNPVCLPRCRFDRKCLFDNKCEAMCCTNKEVAINGACRPAGTTLCGNSLLCKPDEKCNYDNKQNPVCCPDGKTAIDGKCFDKGTTLCTDGKTMCPAATPQCTVNVSVYIDSSGGAVSNIVCCASGEKALNGKCYPGKAKLMPCYRDGDKPCNWGDNYYCAWNAGNGDSKCCKLDEYYKGVTCVKKP